MRVGLIDYDGRVPNLALMQLSSFYKERGDTVLLNGFARSRVDHVDVSVLFTWHRAAASRLSELYPEIRFGGTGWDLETELPREAQACRPDYGLYREEDILPRIRGIMKRETRAAKARVLVRAGVGRTTLGCPRRCPFCPVWRKEGELRQAGTIGGLVNPASKVVVLLDNNLTADPLCLGKLEEARRLDLTLDISQGVDLRFMTPEIALALSRVRHLRSIHYAWDCPADEREVLSGIAVLSRYMRTWRHLCYLLTGFDTSFEEDMHRARTLIGLGVAPYVMPYNDQADLRGRRFERWINGRFYKSCSFSEYRPWVRDRVQYALPGSVKTSQGGG